jgi:Tfp pilus assembly protein PilF
MMANRFFGAILFVVFLSLSGGVTAADDSTICMAAETAADAVIAACSRVIAVGSLKESDLAIAHLHRANASVSKGDLDQAIADYNRAIQRNPSLALAYKGRGNISRMKNEYDRAIADYDKAIKLDPIDAESYFYRAVSFHKKGDLSHAMEGYDEVIRLNPNAAAGAYHNRGMIWRTNGNIDNAIADYSEAIRTAPDRLDSYTRRGQAYEAKGERNRALADYNAVVKLPAKDDAGKLALETARARLAVLNLSTPDSASPQTVPLTQAEAVIRVSPNSSSRLALVIGNGAYKHAPTLLNPPNDARAVAKSLRDIGFQVIEAVDLDRRGMEQAILEFLHRVSAAKIATVYYAGHALQVDGRNYLMPIDANNVTRQTAAFELIDVDKILAPLDDDTRSNIVILDACRNNPLETRIASTRSAEGAGLAAYSTVSSGMLIAFATSPGKVAEDGNGAHSPFTASLLKHLPTPNIEINEMFRRVRVDVVKETERKQVPWINSSLLGEIYLMDDQKKSTRSK